MNCLGHSISIVLTIVISSVVGNMSLKSGGDDQVRRSEDYFWLFFTAALCVFVLGGAIIIAVFLHVELRTMQNDLHEDVTEIMTLTEEAWTDIMHLEPLKDPFESALLIGHRVKKQASYVSANMKPRSSLNADNAFLNHQNADVHAESQQRRTDTSSTLNTDNNDQKCVCGKISTACPRGPPGSKGEQGEPGEDGLPGVNGSPGPPGEEFIFEEIIPPCVQCPSGPPGLPGVRGRPGFKGPDGVNGADGSHGRDGHNGPKGCRGDVGSRGPRGPPGQRGIAGKIGTIGIGLPGLKGLRGNVGIRGPVGHPGRNGSPGPIGFIGLPGHIGHNGKQGPNGPPGNFGPPGNDAINESYCPCPLRIPHKQPSYVNSPRVPPNPPILSKHQNSNVLDSSVNAVYVIGPQTKQPQIQPISYEKHQRKLVISA